MGNEELPEHTLGCTAQRDVFFHRQHIGKATDILHAHLCNPAGRSTRNLRSHDSLVYKPAYHLSCMHSSSIFAFYSMNP